MEKSEIEKAAHNQKPIAKLKGIRMGKAHYSATIVIENKQNVINFEVPVSDMGEKEFYVEMGVNFLLRWITI